MSKEEEFRSGMDKNPAASSSRRESKTMDQAQPKIRRGTEGLETITPQMIEERASEIARAEGRAEANDLDRTRAREHLTSPTSGSEQTSTVGEPDRDWYTPLGSSGREASTLRAEDEENIPEKLIRKRR